MRVHGNVYKIPDVDQDKIDDLANVFLIDTDIEDLSKTQQAQARNVTKSIFVVQQDDESVTVDFVNDVTVDPDQNGGAVNAVRHNSLPGPHRSAILMVVTERRCSEDQASLQYYRAGRL